MTISSLPERSDNEFLFEPNRPVIAAIRLALASTVLVAYLIDIPGQVSSNRLTWAVIAGYLLYSVLLLAAPQLGRGAVARGYIYWIDLAWYGLLTFVTDPSAGGIFLFYFFAILAASFHQGSVAGMRIALASAVVYMAVILLGAPVGTRPEPVTLFLRAFFLVTLGMMIAVWGGSELVLKKRLAFLRELNALSNPRFGAEVALLGAMTKLRVFFGADSCSIVVHSAEANACYVRDYSASASGKPEPIPRETAHLLAPRNDARILQSGPALGKGARGAIHGFDPATGTWAVADRDEGARVADIMNARAFISVPRHSGSDKCRVYLTSRRRRFARGDALFFAQAVEQVFRLIEHARALDRLASGAAASERGRIVTDLHDTTIQPYIGLRIGLAALRTKLGDAQALTEALDKLLAMTATVIRDLRSYIGDLERNEVVSGDLLAPALQETAARFHDFHGLAVELQLQPGITLSDRLAAEVLQMANEGLSNVLKHTRASRCTLALSCVANCLHLRIDNPSDGDATGARFSPRSISNRALALGGTTEVEIAEGRATVIHVTIPL